LNGKEIHQASGGFMSSKNGPLLITSAAALLAMVIFGTYLKWKGLNFTVKVTDVGGLLAPLAVAAAFIERAVEILISPWRDGGANKLANALEAVKARPVDPAANTTNAVDLKAASDTLDEYREKTQQYAFAASFTLGMLTSIAGVRALWQFVDHTQFPAAGLTSDPQQAFFLCLDVVLSAALLAGGADGIHSIANAITSFFNASAEKAKS
jgi:hypothetical protein